MSKIISVNAGSSSLKFQLFEMGDETVITSGVMKNWFRRFYLYY